MSMDWTQIPPEILELIAGKIKVYADYLRFRAVCRAWHASAPKTPFHLPPQLPWLMAFYLPSHPYDRLFYSPSTHKTHVFSLPELSSPNKRPCGSSHGWLVVLDESPAVLLLNPLSHAMLHLPPLFTFPNVDAFDYSHIGMEYSIQLPDGRRDARSVRQMRDAFISKVVLSSSPAENPNFVALAILAQFGDLTYCRNGDECWRFIEGAPFYCEDATFHDGKLYVVEHYGGVTVCDFSEGYLRVLSIEAPSPREFGGDMEYLVYCNDDLLLVTRHVDIDFSCSEPHLRTTEFQIFRLDCGGSKWERLRSLGDKMLFLGQNSSLALSAADFPGAMGDCIYFTDDNEEISADGDFGDGDLGVFKLWNGSIEPLLRFEGCSLYHWHGSPRLWVALTPC